ncbi:MAG: extracellular solute-binding protein [Treponema sp.]|jgi:ABC-type glycerol-3-phosphate transport system substrate-binding protein|nr:extracellular solute-binding protein [Treponema sp.]
MRINLVCAALLAVSLISCGGGRTAVIWTDRPEFALYGEYFNTIQNQYKVTVKFFESPSPELGNAASNPDIIAGSWLKNASTGTYFRTLDNLFGNKKLSRSVFYPVLLAAGRIDRSQYLLPVSFNIPALIFSRDKNQEMSNFFTIGFDEIKELSKNYNAETRGAYTRMGFSPLWNNNFLFTAAVLSGASFREAVPLAWDSAALNRSMDLIYEWTYEINTGSQAGEDFTFKYFFEPQEKLVQSGRILFSYMESRELFTLSEDSKNNIDFRWIMENDSIPVTEDLVFLGIPKKAKSTNAAKAFIQWFFQLENQGLLLEYSKANRINETVFGICGGFSALSSVTEQIFPRFYPELLGRMPPSENFMPPNVLPANWHAIKERIVLPYLNERAGKGNADEAYPLERRLSDWMRTNR